MRDRGTSTSRKALLALLALALPTTAFGQDGGLDPATAPLSRLVDPHAELREAYARGVSAALGEPSRSVWVIGAQTIGSPPSPEVMLMVELGDGLEIERQVYRSPDYAIAASGAGSIELLHLQSKLEPRMERVVPSIGEVRGAELVRLHGQRLADPAKAKAALAAAWSTLPAPPVDDTSVTWLSRGTLRDVIAVHSPRWNSRWMTDREVGVRATVLGLLRKLRETGETEFGKSPEELTWIGERRLRARFAPSLADLTVTDYRVMIAIGPDATELEAMRVRHAELFPQHRIAAANRHLELRETFARGVGAALGERAEVRRFVPLLRGPPVPNVSLAVELGDGLEIRREVYRSSKDAIAASAAGSAAILFLRSGLEPVKPAQILPSIGEVRGAEIVRLRGQRLSDPAKAKAALAAAWSALAAPPIEQTSVSWLEPGTAQDVVAVYRYPAEIPWSPRCGKRPELLETLRELRETGKTRFGRRPEELAWIGERHVRARFTSSLALLEVTDDGEKIAIAPSAKELDALRARHAALFPQLPIVAPAAQASSGMVQGLQQKAH